MKLLIIGNGGREHAIAWKCAQSPQVEQIWVAPGNAGTAQEYKVQNIAIQPTDTTALLQFATKNEIDLTIVGPEAPLAAGVVDLFKQAGLACFGPTRAASRLESSKAFCKDFMQQYKIPTAHYAIFQEQELALDYLQETNFPVVIKADGLAAGKGVIIAENLAQAEQAVHSMLEQDRFGSAGHRIVIEEFLQGEELSYIAMCDGKHILPFASSQDHKRRDDADLGPNTGGMGAYSPAPILTPELEQRILQTVMQPVVDAMATEGNPYIGFLYAGLMVSPNGEAKVLEFNCRLGDPETQPLMMRLQSDLVGLCLAALEGRLHTASAEWDKRSALTVVLAAGGYPESYNKGDAIEGLNAPSEASCKVFHAGTTLKDDQIVTNGGRVLGVTALGETIAKAQALAYQQVKQISWPDMFYRTDIGYKALVTT